MDITDFNRPVEHPWGTFGSAGAEGFMWWFLIQCFEEKNLDAVVKTTCDESRLVGKGWLRGSYEKGYQLTTRSKGLLHSVYGKEK